MEDGRTLADAVRQSASGDAASFRALVDHLSPKLFSFLCGRTASRDDAREALQDTLVDLWHALPRFVYRSDVALYRFAFTIARRKVAKLYTAPAHVPLDVADDEAAASHDGELARAQERVAVAHAISTLEKTARDIVTLRHWSGFSFKEIGSMLSMTESAVRVRHHRALLMMRRLLKHYD